MADVMTDNVTTELDARSPFGEFFRFKIGDFVCHTSASFGEAVRKREQEKYKDIPKTVWRDMLGCMACRLFIVERNVQECPGGHKPFYTLRMVTDSGGIDEKLLTLHEFEVMEFPKE